MSPGTSETPSESWKARETVPVRGSTSSETAARPSSTSWRAASRCRLKTVPACVGRSTRPERCSSGAPTSRSSLASARETPGWLTCQVSATSVTVTPSTTCWNQRIASVSMP